MISYELASEWKEAQEQMRIWKEREMELRKRICGEVYDMDACVEETFKITVGDINLKIVAKTTTSVDEEKLDGIWESMSEQEQACFNFKPALVKKNLDKIDEDSLVWEVLTKKPAAPTVSC